MILNNGIILEYNMVLDKWRHSSKNNSKSKNNDQYLLEKNLTFQLTLQPVIHTITCLINTIRWLVSIVIILHFKSNL